ncbi:hypothetical protein [Tateyamaria sp.]|uniref:hypothetical protein n=1 Tax=Tateyamaria sp. TaxID=1929288 RepID=UPI00329CCCB2
MPVLEAYGMTEASHQIASARIDATRPGAVGPASQNVDISLRHAMVLGLRPGISAKSA